MSRSEYLHNSNKNYYSKQSSNLSYYPSYSPNQNPPPASSFAKYGSQFNSQSQKNSQFNDNSSINSYNAVEGSLKDSGVSFNSGGSFPSRKSDKSLISNYAPAATPTPAPAKQPAKKSMQSSQNDEAENKKQTKVAQDKNVKKGKQNYFIDEDYYYSSEFKRNFVKGMLALAKNKNIEDISLLLKQIAPTLMVRSNDTSLWVDAFLIVFKVEHRMRRIKITQQDVVSLVEDELIEFMHNNKDIKKPRLIKIIIYLFKQLPIHKPKVIQWFQDFIRNNIERLKGIQLSKYIDIYTINPSPIDYSKMSTIRPRQERRILQSKKQKRRFRQIDGDILSSRRESEFPERTKNEEQNYISMPMSMSMSMMDRKQNYYLNSMNRNNNSEEQIYSRSSYIQKQKILGIPQVLRDETKKEEGQILRRATNQVNRPKNIGIESQTNQNQGKISNNQGQNENKDEKKKQNENNTVKKLQGPLQPKAPKPKGIKPTQRKDVQTGIITCIIEENEKEDTQNKNGDDRKKEDGQIQENRGQNLQTSLASESKVNIKERIKKLAKDRHQQRNKLSNLQKEGKVKIGDQNVISQGQEEKQKQKEKQLDEGEKDKIG